MIRSLLSSVVGVALEAIETLFRRRVTRHRGYIDDGMHDYVTTVGSEVGVVIWRVGVPIDIRYGERDRDLALEESRSTSAEAPGCAPFGYAECGRFAPIANWCEVLECCCTDTPTSPHCGRIDSRHRL